MPPSSHKTAYWRRHVAEHRASGLSQADYCRQHKLKPARLTYWICKLGGERAGQPRAKTSESRRFVPVQIVPAASATATPSRGGTVRVMLPDGVVVESSGDVTEVALLVAMLRGRAS